MKHEPDEPFDFDRAQSEIYEGLTTARKIVLDYTQLIQRTVGSASGDEPQEDLDPQD